MHASQLLFTFLYLSLPFTTHPLIKPLNLIQTPTCNTFHKPNRIQNRRVCTLPTQDRHSMCSISYQQDAALSKGQEIIQQNQNGPYKPLQDAMTSHVLHIKSSLERLFQLWKFAGLNEEKLRNISRLIYFTIRLVKLIGRVSSMLS
jgi:hypothetical protein